MKTSQISSPVRTGFRFCALLTGLALALPFAARASLPNTGAANLTVILGSATYPALGNGTVGSMTINSTATTTVLGWSNFSDSSGPGGALVGGDTINFSLPNSTAAILNEVSGGAATTINGSITSNGKVFILNSSGITIGATGSISAAGFYASTVPETLSYFNSFNMLQVFTSTPPATATSGVVIVNAGATLATTSGTGTIGLAGKTVSIDGLATAVTGSLYLETQAPAVAGTTVTLANTAVATTIGAVGSGGNLTIVTNGGDVNLANAANVSITGSATINTSGSVINGMVKDTAGMSFTASGASTASTINAGTGAGAGAVNFKNDATYGTADFTSIGITGGPTTLVDTTANTVSLAATSITGTLAVTSTLGSIASTGSVAATGNVSLTANTVGKTISLTTSGNVNFGAISSAGGTNSVTITGTGNLNFTGAVTSPTVTITTTGGTYADVGIGATVKATVSSSGNMSLGAENTPLLSATSSGTITQTAAITSAAATFNAPTITLTSATNAITAATLLGGGGSGATPVNLVDAVAGLTIGTTTNVTGAASITNNGSGGVGGIAFGAAGSDTLTFGSTLALTATGTGTITTVAGILNVTGAVTANSTNSAITLGLASTTNSKFGQINGGSGSGTFTVNSSGAVNLGTITNTSGGIVVLSGGNITNTGNLVVTTTGGATLTAGTTGAPGSIQLGATGAANNDVISGTITVNNASSFTLWDKPGAPVTVATGTNALPSATIAVTDGNNLIVDASTSNKALAALQVAMTGGNGNVTVTDAGSLTLSNATNVGTGAFSVTVSGTGSTLTFGSGVALAGTGAASFTATGTGANITDSASSPITIAGTVALTAPTISLTSNNTSSFGQLSLTSTGSVAVTEGPNANIGSVTLTGTSGTLSVTSVTGNVIQGGGATAITIPTGYTAATFSAPAGLVSLNFATGNAINSTVPVALTAGGAGAGGNSVVINNGAISFGNVKVTNGTFTVSTLASGGAVSQATGSSLFEYGTCTLTTQGGAITLSNAGNNFGGLAIDATNGGAAAAGANVSVREGGTNHYVVVKTGTGGNFTAVDDQADIIQDSGAGTGLIVGGATSLTAGAGNITLNNALNNFGGGGIKVVTTTGSGNASITDLNGTTLVATGTSVGGNLTITNSAANGIIRDAGAASSITVTGNLSLLAATGGTGYVQFTGGSSTFGGVQITAGSGTTNLLDNASLVILGGTNVTGPAALTSSGDITTNGASTTSFGSTLSLVASGKIFITNRINVAGGLSVDAIAGPTDLSILSKAANLSGIAVVNLGNATNYFGPSP